MAARGYNCILKLGGTTLGIARNFDPTYNSDLQDITTRDSAGWKDNQGGQKSWTASIEALWVPTDTGLQALWNAYIAGTAIVVLWTDENGNGRSGNAVVGNFHPGAQDLANAVMVSCELTSSGAVTVVGVGS